MKAKRVVVECCHNCKTPALEVCRFKDVVIVIRESDREMFAVHEDEIIEPTQKAKGA